MEADVLQRKLRCLLNDERLRDVVFSPPTSGVGSKSNNFFICNKFSFYAKKNCAFGAFVRTINK